MNKAIIYVRVSSLDQVTGTSLDTQEDACKAYCQREGLEVAKVYREEGESAKTADRPQLLKALEHCQRKDVGTLVVWKVDRLSRNQLDFHTIRAMLSKVDVKILSASETLTDNPSGRLMEGILASFAQFDNEVRAERSKGGMAALASEGYWVWKAPTGYRNVKTAENRPTIEPIEEVASFIKEAFERAARGESQAGIARFLRDNWVRTNGQNPPSTQLIYRMLQNQIYAGFLKSSLSGPDLVQGKWEPIVGADLFQRVQEVLGNATMTKAKETDRSEFPLRGWLRCEYCGQALTAGFSRGRRGGRYGYYRCHKCKGINVRDEVLEEKFCELLDSFQVGPDLLGVLKRATIKAYEKDTEVARNEMDAARRAVDRLNKKRDRLLKLLTNGTISEAEYSAEAVKNTVQLAAAREREDTTSFEAIDIQTAFEHSFLILSRPSKWWGQATYGQRRHIADLIFPGGVTFDGETFRTPQINSALNDLRQIEGTDSRMVTPRGFEPLLQG